MRVRLIGALVGASLLIVVVFSIPLIGFVSRVERDRLVTALERDAFVLAGHAKETLNTTSGAVLPSLQPFVDEFSSTSSAKVVVTNSQGLAVSSNDSAVAVGTDFSNRPEIASALVGNPSVGERNSATLGERLVFVAVPVLLGDGVLGVVRLSNPKSVVDEEVRDRVLGIVLAGVFTLVAAAAFAVPIALGIARPITRLTRRTEKLAMGDFSVRAEDSVGPPEVRELSRSFNAMAGRLGLMIEGQRQFANSVSHQLRTPLTALRLRLEQAQEMIRDGQPKGSSSPAEGGNLLATLIDIKKAYLQLDVEDQTLLRLRHFDNYTLQQIAGQLECAVSTADRRCNSSLRKLNELLGGQSPWQ